MEKAKSNNLELDNYFDCCPICHARGCPVRIGYYFRYALELSSQFFEKIPIVRFKCRRKGNPKIKAVTFSLLPDSLIPYHRYTIDTCIAVIIILLSLSMEKALQHVYNCIFDEELNTSERTILRLYNLFSQSCIKLKNFYSSNRNKAPPDFYNYNKNQILKYMQTFQSEGIGTGAKTLAVFYYQSEGAYIKNARFLFGTASQFRLDR